MNPQMLVIDGLVGIPYVPGGRERDGLDCYGLLRLALLDAFHVELPLMATGPVSPVSLARALTRGAHALGRKGHLVRTHPDAHPCQRPLIAVCWHEGIARHCGLRLGLRMLHTNPETGSSVLQRHDHYKPRAGNMEFYQWQ